MKRKQILTSVAMLILALLTVAAAAYAPHSQKWSTLSEKAAAYAPCSSTLALPLTEPFKTAPAKEKYPVPSPDVIARGHSGTPAK